MYVDLRANKLAAAQLVVRVFENEKETGMATALLSAQESQPLEPGQKIALTVDAATQTSPITDWPVTVTVPFPVGTMWDVNRLRLVDGKGNEVPAQKEAINLWADQGSIKWVRFDARVSSDKNYFVEISDSGRTENAASTKVTIAPQGDGRAVIDTGVARYVVGKGASPIREVWMGKQKIATSDGAHGLYVIDQKGRLASASEKEETMQVEASGPQVVCVRFEGYYKTKEGEPVARHITRIEAFAGHAFAKVTHTLVLCRDSNEVWFKEAGWEYSVTGGGNPRALFGVDRDRPDQSVTQTLGGSVKSAYMLQDQHYRFMSGDNHFSVNTVDAAGKSASLREGKECGDWAVLAGDQSSLLAVCRESARQHPKEFEVTAGRLNLKLFSSRTGEELDFRVPTLAKMWGLKEWLKLQENVMYESRTKPQEEVVNNVHADVLKLPSNAIGWAKTHDLLFCPLSPTDAATTAPQLAAKLTFPVYIHVDPKWVYRTEAFGPLHPKDSERFPDAEDTLQKVFEEWDRRDADLGLFGFIYFNTGPFAWPARLDPKFAELARWKGLYNVRRDLLLMAARSTDRAIRARAEDSNRSALDTYIHHWDGPKRVRGGWILNPGSDAVTASPANLPLMWEGQSSFDMAGPMTENLVMLYHLTGDRRAKEVNEDFFRSAKSYWTATAGRNMTCPIRYLTIYAQGYAFNGDREMADMARATLNELYDPQAALLVNQIVYSASYKVQEDIHNLIHAWWSLGDQKFYDLAMTRSRFLFNKDMGTVVSYQSAQGIVSSFLYRQTGDPMVAQDAATLIRQIGAFYDPATKQLRWSDNGVPRIVRNSARVGALMTGLMFGEDTVVRSDADRRSVASFAGASFWTDERENKPGPAGSIIVQKPTNRPLEMRYYSYDPVNPSLSSPGEVRFKRLDGKEGDWGTDINVLQAWIDGLGGQINLEKFAPPGAYEVSNGQTLMVLANERSPMVVHAPGDWTPYPGQQPSPPIYFKVPPGATDARIVIEGSARLFDSAGKPFPDDNPVSGEIKLPADRPGLWNFQPVVNKKVRVVNLPPFFAFRDPAMYFEPALPTQRVATAAQGK